MTIFSADSGPDFRGTAAGSYDAVYWTGNSMKDGGLGITRQRPYPLINCAFSILTGVVKYRDYIMEVGFIDGIDRWWERGAFVTKK